MEATAEKDCTRTGTPFSKMALDAGLEKKGMYTMREIAIATGIPYFTVRDERTAGRLKGFLPSGRKQGWYFKPEWVDEWIEEGTHERVA